MLRTCSSKAQRVAALVVVVKLNNKNFVEHFVTKRDMQMYIQIEKKIKIKNIVGCLPSIFNIINDDLTNGIMMRFKRVSNYNEMESQEALILDMSQPQLGYTDNDIIKRLFYNGC